MMGIGKAQIRKKNHEDREKKERRVVNCQFSIFFLSWYASPGAPSHALFPNPVVLPPRAAVQWPRRRAPAGVVASRQAAVPPHALDPAVLESPGLPGRHVARPLGVESGAICALQPRHVVPKVGLAADRKRISRPLASICEGRVHVHRADTHSCGGNEREAVTVRRGVRCKYIAW